MSTKGSAAVIEVQSISKMYGSSIEPSVDCISFGIPKGQVFGLLGPNGAGKTTTISMLCGLIMPTTGSIHLFGENVRNEFKRLKPRLGIVPQDIALYPTLTGRENLEFYGAMYGVAKVELASRINHWLNKFELQDKANSKVETYSGGMKRRLNLIAGILHNPEVLFLDEPTVGVDVQSRAAIIDQLTELNKAGMTIVYTSHHLEEAQSFCDMVAIIDHGKIIEQGKPKVLVDRYENCNDLQDVFLLLTSRKLRN